MIVWCNGSWNDGNDTNELDCACGNATPPLRNGQYHFEKCWKDFDTYQYFG
jgi:hypothetical protein